MEVREDCKGFPFSLLPMWAAKSGGRPTAKGVRFRVVDSHTGNYPEDDFTPLETIRRGTFDMWDITVEDVERIRQFLIPNVHDVIKDVIQPLILKTLHTTPPNEDYVAPVTRSLLDELLEEFEDEILNVTMVDEGADFNPNKDIEELEKLLADDPKPHYMEIQVYNNEETKFEVTLTRKYVVKCKNAARNMEKDLKCNVIRILRDFTELTTPFQVKWLAKLLGFDYEISYNKGSENVVADALSRLTSGEIIQKLTNGTQTGNKYIGEGSVLKREGKVTVGADEQLRSIFVQHYYADAVGGHSGTNVIAHKLLKVELKMSTAYHLQTDGQTEVVNKCVEFYFRCMTGERYRSLQARDVANEMVKFHITIDHNRMKKYADLTRSEREFVVGMWVYLKLQPHRQVTIKKAVQNTLFAKYYGPFLIIAKMRVLPHCGTDGLLVVEPGVILDRIIGKLNNRAAAYVLVKWVNHPKEDASWELC
ncbi:reverse transcriptase [Tanacetum coccineum]